jgi:hypothetical protein
LTGTKPVARVISADAFDVDGITSPARNYVPAGIGGEVSTRSATAVIQFSNGVSVVLQPNSQLKICGGGYVSGIYPAG